MFCRSPRANTTPGPLIATRTIMANNKGAEDTAAAALVTAVDHLSVKGHEEVPPLLGADGDVEKLHEITLINKIPVNHDTRVFRFALPSSHQLLGIY